MALSFYNIYEALEILEVGEYRLEVVGEGSRELDDPAANLAIRCYEQAFTEWGREPPGLAFRALNAVPLCRGLGSSASAVVGGVLLANALRERPFPREELLDLMVRLEGHPDNVVPACLGGMVVSCLDNGTLRHVKLSSLPERMTVVVAVPEYLVNTADARDALPESVPLKDAVFNVSRAALLTAAWATGAWEHLAWATEDKLHQQFRARLFPGGENILEEVKECPGCRGVAISGSGPSMMAFVEGTPKYAAERMCRIFAEHGVRSRFYVLDIDEGGAQVHREGALCPC